MVASKIVLDNKRTVHLIKLKPEQVKNNAYLLEAARQGYGTHDFAC